MNEILERVFDILSAPAADAIRLAWMTDPTEEELASLDGMDLRLVLEYERKPGGAVRVRLVDRTALVSAFLKAQLPGPAGPEDAERLYAALEEAAEAHLTVSGLSNQTENP